MNNTVKEKWVKALRSGEYEQTTSQLRTDGWDGSVAYCCLGVLCDLYAKEGRGAWRAETNFEDKNGEEATVDLPPDVKKWAGVDEADETMLVAHNDTDEVYDTSCSFKEIADLIETYL